MPTPAWSMAEINALGRDELVARLGFLFEGSPWIVSEVWATHPWENVDALHAALVKVVASAPEERQLALIRAHPDLVGRAALAGTLTRESTAEQRAAGLDPDVLAPEELAQFLDANRTYQARFGFPFVICARENRKESILAGFSARLRNEPGVEAQTALAEIGKIAWYRLSDIVHDDDPAAEEAVTNDQYRFRVSYGKQGVPIYRVFATPLRDVRPIPESPFTGRENNLLAYEIGIEVFGDDFLRAYTHGDNSMVVATDSMKNFIIREALAYQGATLEGLLHFLGTGFSATYPQLHTLKMTGREIPFTAAVVPDGKGTFHMGGNLFRRDGGERASAAMSLARQNGSVVVTGHECGIEEITLMKLTGSAFTSFVRDGYTTLPERGDRPLYIRMDIGWRYGNVEDMLDLARGRYVPAEQLRDLLSTTFDEFVSESIQHLIHEMGTRALTRFPQLHEISFAALNLTRDPYGQRAEDTRVRVYSDPFPAYGRLTLTITRAD